jgi:hypothetical protein
MMQPKARIPNHKKAVSFTTELLLSALVLTQPAAAQTAENCSVPSDLQPLIDLLNTLGELAFIAGIALATIGFSVAGLLFMMPGVEYTRRAKQVGTNVFIGAIILLSANMVVSFLVSQLGTTMCT